MDTWLVNGSVTQTLDINDRGLAYGDGLFETIAIREATCRFLDAHLKRLRLGCRKLAIAMPDEARLQADIAQLIATEKCRHGVLKILVTRGTGPRGYAYKSSESKPTCMVGIAASEPEPAAHEAIRIRLCTTQVSRHQSLGGIKSLNRLPQVLARAEWDDPDIAEGLMTDDRGNLIGGTMTNLFISDGKTLFTPPITDCGVAGVMRGQIIAAARSQNVNLREQHFGLDELAAATEVFLTNSLIGIWPVKQCENYQFTMGPLTRRLSGAMAAQGVNECQA